MTLAVEIIKWDSILESYGPDAKIALRELLSKAQIRDDDPAALVIAAMFIAQIDSNRAFSSITKTIDDGKVQLNTQFEEQILKLRGVVDKAKENLVETSKGDIEKHKSDILDVIKLGVAKAIGREGDKRHERATWTTGTTMICASVLTLLGLVVGAVGVSLLRPEPSQPVRPVTTEELEAVPNGQLWLQIVNANQEALTTCVKNADTLEHLCVMKIP